MANRTAGAVVTAPYYNEDTFDIGDVKWSARRNPTSGWLVADGSAVSRTTYSDLFAALVPSLGTFTVTIASPGVFTLTGHGLAVGDTVYLTTTGALPTGLAANTLYYVVAVPDANTFMVGATSGGPASEINTSGTQSGTHTLWWCPYGLGDGSTTFNLPHEPITGFCKAGASSFIADGYGFTFSKSSTGVYVITFNVSFATPPAVIVGGVVAASGNRVVAQLPSDPTVSGFTINVNSAPDPNTAVDADFTFTAGGAKPAREARLFVKYA